MKLIDADIAAAFAKNCGATFVAKRLRDSKALRYGKPGTLTCHNRRAPCNRRNVGSTDFCSYGEPKEV